MEPSIPLMNGHSPKLLYILAAILFAAAGDGLSGEKGASPTPLPLLDGEPQLGRWIALSGETTTGGADKYEWQQKTGPSVRFLETQRSEARVWIFLEKAGKYRFALRAGNQHGWSKEVPLAFEVPAGKPALPLEEAFIPAGAGEKVLLPGEAWKQLGGPPVRQRQTADRRHTAFRVLQAGLYIFEAWRAGDTPERRGVWVPPGRDAVMGNRRPVAVLPPTCSGRAGHPILLDASLSYDRDGPDEPLTARWHADLVHGATLAMTGPLKAAFLAPKEGVYKVELVVSDGKMDSLREQRLVHVVATHAPQPVESVLLGRPSNDPMEKRVKLRLHESTLDDAVQRFPSRCKVALRVDPGFLLPKDLWKVRLDVGVERGSVRMLMNWIARQADAWYRIEPNGALWLTSAMAWAREKTEMKSLLPSVDALHDEEDAGDLMRILKHAMRGVLRECADARLVYQPEKDQVLAVLPKPAAERMDEILRHLRAPKGLGLPPPLPPQPNERALRQTLGTKRITVNWVSRRLDLLLRDIERKTGIPVGLDPRHFPDGFPKITLQFKEALLRQVIRDVVEEAGLDGCQVDPSGGLWFYRGAEPYPWRELPWDHMLVQTYDLEPILVRLPMLSGEAVAHLVRQQVYADSWATPGTCCLFHKPTGKLIVLHGPLAQDRVARVLWDLLVRGEWAMGPVLLPEK